MKRFLSAWMVFCIPIFALGQNTRLTLTAQEAETLFQAQKWSEAVTAYQHLSKEAPQQFKYWYQLGFAHQALKQYPIHLLITKDS